MRRKLLMLAAPVALVIASLSTPAFALANCSCGYCAQTTPDRVCNDTSTGTSTFCVNYTSSHCP
jgi:hypothetical protein